METYMLLDQKEKVKSLDPSLEIAAMALEQAHLVTLKTP